MAIELTVTKNTTDKEKGGFIDELTYTSYKFNRDRSPEIAPEQWRCIFPDVDKLERRYKQEVS